MADLARYIHETLAQDIVQLSYVVDVIQSRVDDSGQEKERERLQDLLEQICSRVRVLSAMLAPVPRNRAVHEWIEDYTDFFDGECGLKVKLDVDPLPSETADSVSRLAATAIQLWLSKIVRANCSSASVVRLRERSQKCIVELESPYSDSLASGWTVLEEAASALAGVFTIEQREERAFGRLELPLRIPEGENA